jgi:hypothetical protein
MPSPIARGVAGRQRPDHANEYVPLRHIGLYAYSNRFLQLYPTLTPAPLERIEALEQLRVLWHGHAIAVHVTSLVPEAGVDTPEDLLRVRKHFEARRTVPWCRASPHSDVKTGGRHDPAQGWPVPLAVSSMSS